MPLTDVDLLHGEPEYMEELLYEDFLKLFNSLVVVKLQIKFLELLMVKLK